MARNFGGDRRVVWADLSDLLDLQNIEMTFDGMHLNPTPTPRSRPRWSSQSSRPRGAGIQE